MIKGDRRLLRASLGIGLLVLVSVLPLATQVAGAIPSHPPVLQSPQAVPYNANDGVKYQFTVHYTSPDHALPQVFQVYVDGNPIDLTLKHPKWDAVYASPKMVLDPGAHKYYFTTTDEHGLVTRSPRYGEWSGPYVAMHKVSAAYNPYPYLSGGQIVQGDQGTIETYFTFKVHYHDSDLTTPRSVQAIVDGLPHDMHLFKGTADDGDYIYNVYMDTAPHGYYFRAVDAGGAQVTYPTEGFIRGPAVDDLPNRSPEITDYDVNPEIGVEAEVFTFQARYLDLDRDPPAIIQEIIDGRPHNMTLVSGKRYDGVYQLRTKLVLSNHHSYAVHAEDGRGGEVTVPLTGTTHGPVVTEY